MKSISKLFFNVGIFLTTVVLTAKGQGTFTNLNFENAQIVLDHGSSFYPYAAFASNSLAGWTAYEYGSPVTSIFYNDVSLGAAAVSIHDTNDSFGFLPIAGSYSVFLQGQDPGTGNETSAIGQTGQIPATAQSMTFWGNTVGSFQISFAGQLISFNPIGSGANYTIYGGDISAYAGQTGQLLFIAPPEVSGFLDNIQFSPSPIPEPTTLALVSVGGLIFGLQRRRRSR